MSKNNTPTQSADDDMLPEYDFSVSTAVRGKYYKKYREGHTVEIRHADGSVTTQHFPASEGVVTLDPDVREYFPDAEAVNTALRTLIALVHRKTA